MLLAILIAVQCLPTLVGIILKKDVFVAIQLLPLGILVTLAVAGMYIDTFFMHNKQVKGNKKLAIAVDFDNTLCRDGYQSISNGYQTLMTWYILKYLMFWQGKGAYIILNTLREDDKLTEAITWLATKGFTPDLSNNNDPEGVITWKHNSRKIACDISIDDRACGLFGLLLREGA